MPGIVGALIDGVLTSSAVIGLLPSVAIRSAVSSNTIGASPALFRSTRPAPKSNGSAGVTRSSLTTSVIAVVISADLIAPGVQSGWSAFSRIAEPAACGDDIEVPAMAWKYSPGGPPATSSRNGRVAGQDLGARRGDVGLEELATRAARRERRHDVALGRHPSHRP